MLLSRLSTSAIVKERPFEASPRRHWTEKENDMRAKMMEFLEKEGCVLKLVTATANPGEYTIEMRINAEKFQDKDV